jgi:cysteinyl-tRNA synthetase
VSEARIRVFNTLTMQKEPLVPLQPGRLGIYVCGPTVYHWVHIGNARTFTSFDVVVRYLRYRGYDVKYVRNVTDVDDRILHSAAKEGCSPQEFAGRFIADFERDVRALKLIDPDVTPKVSDHIPEIIALIQRLIDAGVAYASAGDVYFQVSRYPAYARLSRRNLDDLRAGDRVQPGEQKREPLDFALWKATKAGEGAAWDSPWGRGRPGWHIECSAMAAKHLGESFDIHGGALDLIFPHHENEIAQSEAASGKPLSRYWMHCGFLDMENVKMSKSLGTMVLLKDALARLDAEALRLFFLSTHYRNQLNFSEKALADADARMEYFYETLRKVDERVGETDPGQGTVHLQSEPLIQEFETSMDDDFNAPGAVAVLSSLFTTLNELVDRPPVKDRPLIARTLVAHRRAAIRIGEVLGLFSEAPEPWLSRRRERALMERGLDRAQVEQLIAQRATARATKNFAESDRLRDTLKAMGVEVMDTPKGMSWRVLPALRE